MPTILGFLSQTSCKIMFVSSTNTEKDETSMLLTLKNTTNDFLNVITYVCPDHYGQIAEYTDAAACACYILQKPVHVSMDAYVRKTSNLFLQGSYFNEIVGTQLNGNNITSALFSESMLTQFDVYRPSTTYSVGDLNKALFVYVDPAFTNSENGSGTGVAVIGKLEGITLVLGVEHFFLKQLTGHAAEYIANCVTECIVTVHKTHENTFSTVYVAVEGNSNQDSGAAISKTLIHSLANAPIGLKIFYTVRTNGRREPFFLLGNQKNDAVHCFIQKFNSGNVLASRDMVSNTIPTTADVVEYLLTQLSNVRQIRGRQGTLQYSGKTRTSKDDLVISLIMATYIQDKFHILHDNFI